MLKQLMPTLESGAEIHRGVARFFDTWGKYPHWPLIKQIMKFKVSQLCTKFPFVWLNNFKLVEHIKWILFIQNIHLAAHSASP
jgi:hypothetical protein